MFCCLTTRSEQNKEWSNLAKSDKNSKNPPTWFILWISKSENRAFLSREKFAVFFCAFCSAGGFVPTFYLVPHSIPSCTHCLRALYRVSQSGVLSFQQQKGGKKGKREWKIDEKRKLKRRIFESEAEEKFLWNLEIEKRRVWNISFLKIPVGEVGERLDKKPVLNMKSESLSTTSWTFLPPSQITAQNWQSLKSKMPWQLWTRTREHLQKTRATIVKKRNRSPALNWISFPT